ncbi:MAG TPA: hypothetical protein HPP41_02710 [Deltaproteobacteria bacterium]|nr:hypothetical protein [Deltaproteobacteria bacterium]
MGSLLGLREYLDESYNISVFDQAFESQEPWELHLYNHRIIRSKVHENSRYDLRLSAKEEEEELLPKTDVKLLYPADLSDSVRPLLKIDKTVRDLGLEPIISPRMRHHIKNKSLFPLIKERRVVFFTLMEGEIVKGLVTGFTRYEITVSLKGGIPIYILRHGVYDLRDKKGLCFLKSFQETRRDWEKSDLFISQTSQA